MSPFLSLPKSILYLSPYSLPSWCCDELLPPHHLFSKLYFFSIQPLTPPCRFEMVFFDRLFQNYSIGWNFLFWSQKFARICFKLLFGGGVTFFLSLVLFIFYGICSFQGVWVDIITTMILLCFITLPPPCWD